MSIKIEITGDTGEEVREKMASLLGAQLKLTWKRVEGPATTSVDSWRAETDLPPAATTEPEPTLTNTPRAGESAAQTEARKRGRPKKTEPAPAAEAAPEPQPNISAQPEHRIDPEAEAQDADDEAAEVAAEPAKTLTAEDLRAVTGRYIGQHGIAAAQEDGVKVFADALGTPPEGADYWTITAAAKSPETLAKAVAAWEAAVAAGKRYGQ